MQKIDDLLVVTLKTQVFTVTILMHKTLYNISRGQVTSTHFIFQGRGRCSQNISYFRRGRLCSLNGGACVMAQWPVQAWKTTSQSDFVVIIRGNFLSWN